MSQQQFADALLNPALPAPSGLSTWNGSDPAARFAVYRNNVTVSLIDALADTFPVTQQLVGEDFFRAAARLFVAGEPPRSKVLAFYGAAFPDFLANFPPAATVPYLADVARLEMLRVHACHAADYPQPAPETLIHILDKPDLLPHCRLHLHPSVRIFRSEYAAVSLWAAHHGLGDIGNIDPDIPESAYIVRPALEVEVIPVSVAAAGFLAHLLAGASLGEAAERSSSAGMQAELADIFHLLIRTGSVTGISHLSGEQHE